jgi:hypothetical protein
MFGADYFYLGFPLWGMAKLLTLGGLGAWWLIDIVRIAAGPVYAYNFRTSNDLPHSAAMLILLFLCSLLGFLAAVETYLIYRRRKRDDLQKLHQSEDQRHWQETKHHIMNEKPNLMRERAMRDRSYGAFAPPTAGLVDPSAWYTL